MLRTRPEFLSETEVEEVHESSLRLMREVGIVMPEPTALEILAHHGARVEGQRVYFPERLVADALASAPAAFTLHGRDPDHNLTIGGEQTAFGPGYGAPFVMDADGVARAATMQDYENLVRLADTLPELDTSGYMLVEPSDVPAAAAYLHMLRANMVLSSKPFMGATDGRRGAEAAIDMACILFGHGAGLRDRPVMISLINSLSPLAYSGEMLEALIEYARWRQPVVVAPLVQAGATGPVTLAGTIVQQNAEALAGITLAQVVSPGTPVVYGGTSTAIDMNTGGLAIGAPELSIMIALTAQLARRYRLPSRSGGSLTDSHALDAQAGLESMMALLTTVASGISFVIHAAGILSGFLAMSFEKFVLDAEVCGMARRFKAGLDITPSDMAVDVIAHVGPGGTFLMEDQTLERCRSEFFRPRVATRVSLSNWQTRGRRELGQAAGARWRKLLEHHKAPEPDELIVRQLDHYVAEHS